jgi:hypothetical protein
MKELAILNELICRKFTKNKYINCIKNGKHVKKAANLLFLTTAAFFLVFQYRENGNISAVFPAVSKYFSDYFFNLTAVLILALAQLFAEAKRWQNAVQSVYLLTFRQASESVFRGVLLNSFLPFGIGNLAGKMSKIAPQRYLNAGFELAAAGFWQSVVGILFALFFLLFFNFFWAAVSFFFIFFTFFAAKKAARKEYFFSESLIKILHSGERVLAISALKHLIFIVQYVILLISEKELTFIFNAASGASFVLGIKSLFPTGNFWTSFFFRESLAAEILQNAGLSLPEIFASGLLLGFCNHLFTALFAGVFLVLFPHIGKEKDKD